MQLYVLGGILAILSTIILMINLLIIVYAVKKQRMLNDFRNRHRRNRKRQGNIGRKDDF